MESYEVIKYKNLGFDNKKYIKLQSIAIQKRVEKFDKGRLYLEIGGKLLFDSHAARVLPGFNPENKIEIIKKFSKTAEFIFCVNAIDIAENRKLQSDGKGYVKSTIELILTLKKTFKIPIYISINLIDEDNYKYAVEYKEYMKELGFDSYLRYKINGYPKASLVLSNNGYLKDEYIPVQKKLIFVTGAASNSGKMSTCLGQIYHEDLKGETSGFAKYETFPIWNIHIDHPINLAYEAATADIGDYNVIDTYYDQAYGRYAVNYNRDVKAFKIIKEFSQEMNNPNSFLSKIKSPTDMGINMAGECITDDEIVSIASLREIYRRTEWYRKLKDREAVRKCNSLLIKALKYVQKKQFEIEISI